MDKQIDKDYLDAFAPALNGRTYKLWDDLKFQIALFLNRNPKWCWSGLVRWHTSCRWYDIFLADERVYSLWITEIVLWILHKDFVDMQLSGEGVGAFDADGSDYCMKCVYIRQRKDCYEQERDRVQRRGDRLIERDDEK